MSFVKSRRPSNSARLRRSRPQPRFEPLETRTLMSGITSYAVGAPRPNNIAADSDGNLWTVDDTGVYKFDNQGNQLLGGILPGIASSIAFSNFNHHIYLADQGTFSIIELGLDGTELSRHFTPELSHQTPTDLTVATDGSVWFGVSTSDGTEPNFPSQIGRMDLSGNMTFADTPNGGVTPLGFESSPDGSVWFVGQPSPYQVDSEHMALSVGAEIGHAHANLDGSIVVDNMYAISTPGSLPTGLTVANDGSVWFGVAYNGDQFEGDGPDRLVHGVLSGSTLVQTEYTIPEPSGVGGPSDVALDNQGRLWFVQFLSNQIGYMDTATGDFTLMAVPSSVVNPARMLTTSTDVWAVAVGEGGDNVLSINFDTFEAPLVSTSPSINATAGTVYTDPLAVFETSDSGEISYSIDYGNGVTANGTLPGGAGMHSILANVTYDAPGTYNTVITISTADGSVVQMHGTAVVTDGSTVTPVVGNGIDLSGPEDQPLLPNRTINGQPALAVATFTGAPANYSAIVTWGDNTTSTGTIVDLGGGMYAVVVSGKTFTANGTYSGSVTISGGTNELTVGVTTTISDTPLVVSTGLTLKPLLGRIVLATTATFTDDVDSSASWFTATISWGDGTSSAGLVVRDPLHAGRYFVIGAHLYSKKGTYTVLTLINNNQENVSATGTATIKV